MNNELAIRVDKLAKLYRIGKTTDNGNNFGQKISQKVTSPFKYLASTLTKPEDDEIIWAIKDISFDVNNGEVVGIIGKNGAGKSTLLKILSRITEPSEGRALLNGRVGSLLEVGTGFHPELTGKENIYLNGAILGMRREEIEAKYEQIVEFSGVSRFLETPVKRYSSGMRVRLAFAVASHLDPEILLIDEVLAVGDAEFQKKCLGQMDRVAKGGRTILFVSHNMLAVQNLCTRVIWLEHGKMVMDGNTSDVVKEYSKSHSSIIPEQLWEKHDSAPGNEFVRIHRINIVPESGSPGDPISLQSSFYINIDYWVTQPDTDISTTIQIHTEQGVIAFESNNALSLAEKGLSNQRGLYRTQCLIPGHLLNNGYHSVRLVFVKDQSRAIYRYEDAISFDVVELNDERSGYFGKQRGVVRPKLTWTSEKIDE
jgi:lipopolysaccharide transport system ATP-binding protein